jgi:hypothetical protein
MTRSKRLAASGILTLALCGCGGGGGGSVSMLPPPPPAPPPVQEPQAVVIFPNPVAGEFASVGTTSKVADVRDPDAALGPISTADADQPHIRFTAANTYEVELPGGAWQELTFYGGGTNGIILNNGADSGGEFFVISGSKDDGYLYSEVASLMSFDTLQIGAFAFGTLTPNGAVPVTGSATYSGIVRGTSDVGASDPVAGIYRPDIDGTVTLGFDFAAGSLDGSMTLGFADANGGPLPIGTFNFKDTVYSTGSPSYSGKFDTNAAGDNFFLGKFTGPHAEETIGAWAVPFTLDTGSSTITADHQSHQAFGAWIAKKP